MKKAGVSTEIQERRRSERLKNDIAKTTQERVDFMAKKRNLEGTSKSHSMFQLYLMNLQI